MVDIGEIIPCQQTEDINHYKKKNPSDLNHNIAKHVEGKHIKDQMRGVYV
jgi:hypothetical protein